MLKKQRNSNYGSLTVEAAIIVPFLVLVLIAVVILCVIMYQKVLLAQTVSLAAQQAAEIWVDDRKSIVNGSNMDAGKKLTIDSLYINTFNSLFFRSPYTEVMDLQSTINKNDLNSEDKRIQKVRSIVYSELSRGLIKAGNATLDIRYANTLIQGKVEVILTQEFRPPLGRLFFLFTGNKTVQLTAKGVAVVEQPAEYIRNVDLIIEYGSDVSQTIDFEKKWKDLKAKIFKSYE